MENEKIFIVVPVYRVEPYLERCIHSILNQTYTNWELVLVDDGSPDSCPAICDEYAAKNSRIHVIHQENAGLSAARNAGIDCAMNQCNPERDWITFIDSDDFVHPKYLEYLYRAVRETGTEISIGGISMTSGSQPDSLGTETWKCARFSPEEFWSRSFTNSVVAWGKLYRLRLFHEIRYPVGKLYEDNYTTYKLLFRQKEIAVTPARLYYWYENPSSITRSLWTPKQLDVLDALDGQIAFFQENGLDAAYRTSLHELLGCVIKQLMYIRAQSPKYDHLIREITVRQRNAFRLYADVFGLKPAVSRWFSVRILRPVRRVLRTESVFSFLKRRIRRKLYLQ